MAYEIIKRLEANNEVNLLSTLCENVEAARNLTRRSMKYGNYHLAGRFVIAGLSLNKIKLHACPTCRSGGA